MRTWIEQALEIHAEGLDIVPIRKGDKRPVTRWKQWQTRRQTAAELHEIAEYFYGEEPPRWMQRDENGTHYGKPWMVKGNMRKRWPDPVELDWAIVTGSRAGVIVVDVDTDDAYDEAVALGLTKTWRSAKSTRGWHFWFKHPGGMIQNAAAMEAVKGLDLRADGGYIRVPPSKDMEWLSESTLDELPFFPLAETPDTPHEDFELDLTGVRVVKQTAEEWLIEKCGGTKLTKGERNNSMAKVVGLLIEENPDREWVTERAIELGDKYFDHEKYAGQETLRIIESIWVGDLKRHAERHEDVPKVRPKLGYISDYNAERFINALPPRKPAYVETIFEPGKATMFAGYAGSGKSELMMQLLKAACDPSKLGKFIGPWEIQATARALVLDPENNPHLIMDRLKRFSLIGNSHDNLRVIPGSVPDADGNMIETALNLTSKAGLVRLGELLQEHRPNIVVFDTVRSHYPGLKENEASEWTDYNVLTQKLTRAGYCVVWLHHSNKPGPDGYSTEAGSSHALTNISTQIFVKPVYRDEAQAKRKHAIWNEDERFNVYSRSTGSAMTPYQTLAKRAGMSETLIERVAQVSYGKVREASPITEETYYLAQASDPKSMDWRPHLWSTPSPKQLAKHYADNGAPALTITRETGVPMALLVEWGVISSDQDT